MTKTTTILGLIGGAAAASIIYIFANAGKHPTVPNKHAAAWKQDTLATFTGWLEKLKPAIDSEVDDSNSRLPGIKEPATISHKINFNR